jgi:hypothetical protein
VEISVNWKRNLIKGIERSYKVMDGGKLVVFDATFSDF